MKKKHQHIVVLSAPSGTGKTTVCHALLKRDRRLRRVITATTRKARNGEKNGRDYYFISTAAFQGRIRKNGFVEYARVHGNMYGTPRSELKKSAAKKKDSVLVIDVQGGLQIRKSIPEAVLIFIKPPSMKELRRRLTGRGLDSNVVMQRRLKNAIRELGYAPRYDYVVVNNKLSQVVSRIMHIIQRARLLKGKGTVPNVTRGTIPNY